MKDTDTERCFENALDQLRAIQKLARQEKKRDARFARLQAMPFRERLDYMKANPKEYDFWRGECARRIRIRNEEFCKKYPEKCLP